MFLGSMLRRLNLEEPTTPGRRTRRLPCTHIYGMPLPAPRRRSWQLPCQAMQLRVAQERLKQTQTESAKAKAELNEMTIENEVDRTRARV